MSAERDLEKKYLALAASVGEGRGLTAQCCVLKYLEFNQSILLHSHSLLVEWKGGRVSGA